MLIGVNEQGIPVGEFHPLRKLTDAQVEEIRTRFEGGETSTRLAQVYGVTKGHICKICNFTKRYSYPVKWVDKTKPKIKPGRRDHYELRYIGEEL